MDMSELKALDSRAQIITLIEKGSLYGGDIWQSGIKSQEGRQITQIIQITNDLKSDKLILRTPSIVRVNPEQVIFIRLNFRNVIFRLFPGQFKVNGDKIICNYPAEARALEERKGGDRYVLPFNADVSISLKRLERSVREITYELELRVIDVSQKGFGILISSHNRDYFKKNDHFWLKSVDHSVLRAPILGTVCYVAPKGYYLKRGDVRVGLSLSLPLSKDIFEGLKRRSQIILTA